MGVDGVPQKLEGVLYDRQYTALALTFALFLSYNLLPIPARLWAHSLGQGRGRTPQRVTRQVTAPKLYNIASILAELYSRESTWLLAFLRGYPNRVMNATKASH